MHGNVFEFCLDWHTIDTTLLWGDAPTGPASGTQRCLRGGRFGNNHRDCRSGFRYPISASTRNSSYGFRVAAPAEVFIAQ
jgi:formylglycine-generating enzyme required for sulfatase activity